MHIDESRSKSVINYLTNTLGLQLIFIIPTSKAGPFLDLISNQFVFSKVPRTIAVGELNTRVLVDRKQLNQERIRELWEQHRRVIHQQRRWTLWTRLGELAEGGHVRLLSVFTAIH